ncbi:unnamed protein product, partial [Prorocentrum cordatum]
EEQFFQDPGPPEDVLARSAPACPGLVVGTGAAAASAAVACLARLLGGTCPAGSVVFGSTAVFGWGARRCRALRRRSGGRLCRCCCNQRGGARRGAAPRGWCEVRRGAGRNATSARCCQRRGAGGHTTSGQARGCCGCSARRGAAGHGGGVRSSTGILGVWSLPRLAGARAGRAGSRGGIAHSMTTASASTAAPELAPDGQASPAQSGEAQVGGLADCFSLGFAAAPLLFLTSCTPFLPRWALASSRRCSSLGPPLQVPCRSDRLDSIQYHRFWPARPDLIPCVPMRPDACMALLCILAWPILFHPDPIHFVFVRFRC